MKLSSTTSPAGGVIVMLVVGLFAKSAVAFQSAPLLPPSTLTQGHHYQHHPSSSSSSSPSYPSSSTCCYYNKGSDDFYPSQQQQQQIEELIPETSFGSEAVPEAQRPINEYLDMTKQPLFGWAAQGDQGLLIRLGIVYAIVFAAVCYPIAGATYTQEGYFVQKLTASNVGAMSLIGLLLLRLYSGWGYVGSRLTSKVVEFEETGWYDGDFEYKTDAEQKRDKFLYMDKVQPVVDRLKTFSFGVAGLWIASILAFNVASMYKPMYDQYDPDMLSRLSYDEKLAEKASIYSGGRPTYCDNRYYRAVANGGQGCDR